MSDLTKRNLTDVITWVEGYRPHGMTEREWTPAVRELVIRVVATAMPADVAVARRLARVAALFGRWAQATGLDLAAPHLFDPEMVETFVRSGMSAIPSRSTYRSALRAVAPLLAPRGSWVLPDERVAARAASTPYSENEIARLARDIDAQKTSTKRRAAHAVFVLGLGAGLDGRWNLKVRGTDVQMAAGAVCVNVPAPQPRLVPVRREFAEPLCALAACGDELLAGRVQRGRNAAGNLQGSVRVSAGSPRLNTGRLRATWIVRHLSEGTRLPELLDAAGLVGLRTIAALIGYVDALDPEARAAVLVGD